MSLLHKNTIKETIFDLDIHICICSRHERAHGAATIIRLIKSLVSFAKEPYNRDHIWLRHTCVFMCVYVHIYTCMLTYTHIYIYTYIHIHIYTYTHIYIYVYIFDICRTSFTYVHDVRHVTSFVSDMHRGHIYIYMYMPTARELPLVDLSCWYVYMNICIYVYMYMYICESYRYISLT